MADFKIEGIDALVRKMNNLSYSGNQARDVVKKNGSELQKQTQQNMTREYTGHYEWVKGTGRVWKKPSGDTRRSATVQISDDGRTATVAPNTKYFPYLEYGTRFMEARPTLKPAFDRVAPVFINDMKRLLDES